MAVYTSSGKAIASTAPSKGTTYVNPGVVVHNSSPATRYSANPKALKGAPMPTDANKLLKDSNGVVRDSKGNVVTDANQLKSFFNQSAPAQPAAANQPQVQAPTLGTTGQQGQATPQNQSAPDVAIPAASTALPNASKYQQGFQSAVQDGAAAPQDFGQASTAISNYTPNQQQDNSQAVAGDIYAQTPELQSIMQMAQSFFQTQKTTLMDDYSKLYKQSGLGDINKELIDTETVINGTEDDIRNEIQSAGGLGTDSQVQAMALARNKSLIARYNALTQQKTDAQNQLNTMLQLDQQDRQAASQQFSQQLDIMFKMADYRQQAQNAIKEQARWLIQTAGADGAYDAYKNDPRQLSMLEQTLGLAPGGLQPLAQQAASARALDIAAKKATIDNANRKNYQLVPGTTNQPGGVFDPTTGTFTPFAADQGSNVLQLAQTKDQISTINDVLSNPYLPNAVGPNTLSRYSQSLLGGIFGGGKAKALGDIQYITENLTLDKLKEAKQNGTTFGALSEGEEALVANAASKINSWAVKNGSGQVVGYSIDRKDFETEMNRINNYARLDYMLRGGNPSDVGVQQMSDGTYWVRNSDGSFTQLQ